MTLMDAPKYDEASARRRTRIVYVTIFTLGFIVLGWWIFTGAARDWPWYWNTHWRGAVTVNRFMKAVEQNDLPKAYGIWQHDPEWQGHHNQSPSYDFKRFSEDWRANGSSNDFGVIRSHDITAARVYGNVLVLGILMNGRKTGAVFLAFDPKAQTLSYSSVELYLGP